MGKPEQAVWTQIRLLCDKSTCLSPKIKNILQYSIYFKETDKLHFSVFYAFKYARYSFLLKSLHKQT